MLFIFEMLKGQGFMAKPWCKLFMGCVVLFFLVNCSEQENTDPLIFTGQVTEVDRDGAMFNMRISNLGMQPILEFGFVWGTTDNLGYNAPNKRAFRANATPGIHSMEITSSMPAKQTIYVRAFARTADKVFFGEEVRFVSQGNSSPEITSFYPDTCNLEEEVIIYGHNFGQNVRGNVVTFDSIEADVVSADMDSIVVQVPRGINRNSLTISIETQGHYVVAEKKLQVYAPFIFHLKNAVGRWGSRFQIIGKNYQKHPASLEVYLGGLQVAVEQFSDKEINVTIPDGVNKRALDVVVSMNGIRTTADDTIFMDDFTVSEILPSKGKSGSVVKIRGLNFSPILNNNRVYFGGHTAEIIRSSLNEITCRVPFLDNGYFGREQKVELSVLGEKQSLEQSFEMNDAWVVRDTCPFGNLDVEKQFVVGEYVYFLMYYSKEFIRYDPALNEWTKMPDFPGEVRTGGTGFASENKLYYGFGSVNASNENMQLKNFKDFWEFDVEKNKWTQKRATPLRERQGAMMTFVDGNAYLFGGIWDDRDELSDAWLYNPRLDTWESIDGLETIDSYPLNTQYGFAETLLGKPYFGLCPSNSTGNYSRRVYYIDPHKSNSWQRVKTFPEEMKSIPISFVLDDTLYLKGYSTNFYAYHVERDVYEEMPSRIPKTMRNGVAFSVGGKAYVTTRRQNYVWELDLKRKE